MIDPLTLTTHTVFIFIHDYSRFFESQQAHTFITKSNILLSTVRHKMERTKGPPPFDPTHSLSPWKEGIIFTKNAVNQVISQRHTTQYSNSSMCLLLIKEADVCTRDRVFCLNVFIKTDSDNI